MKRWLLLSPFFLTGYLYLYYQNDENSCQIGLVDGVLTIALIIFNLITLAIAMIAVFPSSKNSDSGVDWIKGVVVLLLVIWLFIGNQLNQLFAGKIWLNAEADSGLSKNSILLRQNGKATITIGAIESYCKSTGNYKVIYDTIIFEDNLIAKTQFAIKQSYVLKDSLLAPITKTKNSIIDTLTYRIN